MKELPPNELVAYTTFDCSSEIITQEAKDNHWGELILVLNNYFELKKTKKMGYEDYKKIYDSYISDLSKQQINLSGKVKKSCDVLLISYNQKGAFKALADVAAEAAKLLIQNSDLIKKGNFTNLQQGRKADRQDNTINSSLHHKP